MRALIENIITEKDAAYLLSLAFNRSIVIWDNPTVNKALEGILEALPQQNLFKEEVILAHRKAQRQRSSLALRLLH